MVGLETRVGGVVGEGEAIGVSVKVGLRVGAKSYVGETDVFVGVGVEVFVEVGSSDVNVGIGDAVGVYVAVIDIAVEVCTCAV